MSVAKTLKGEKPPSRSGRYLSIDSSSKSLAFSIFDRSGDKTVLSAAGKINFPDGMRQKLLIINATIKAIFDHYKTIDHVIIEQTIYIQSPQTSRILSYIVGHIWGESLHYCPDVRDVEIMKWKAHIKYKNVTKGEIAVWEDKYGATEAKKIASKERKERTGNLIKQKIKNIDHVTDYDIIDAIAIGLWSIDNV